MARDGSVSQIDYEKVEALVKTGVKKTAAIAAVAQELAATAGALLTSRFVSFARLFADQVWYDFLALRAPAPPSGSES